MNYHIYSYITIYICWWIWNHFDNSTKKNQEDSEPPESTEPPEQGPPFCFTGAQQPHGWTLRKDVIMWSCSRVCVGIVNRNPPADRNPPDLSPVSQAFQLVYLRTKLRLTCFHPSSRCPCGESSERRTPCWHWTLCPQGPTARDMPNIAAASRWRKTYNVDGCDILHQRMVETCWNPMNSGINHDKPPIKCYRNSQPSTLSTTTVVPPGRSSHGGHPSTGYLWGNTVQTMNLHWHSLTMMMFF